MADEDQRHPAGLYDARRQMSAGRPPIPRRQGGSPIVDDIRARLRLLFYGPEPSEETEKMVLATLTVCGEMSGYDLREASGAPTSAFYATTMRLESQGRIASRWGVATEKTGWARPRLYRIANDV